MARFCIKCGTKNANDVTICSGCGESLLNNSVEQPTFKAKKEEDFPKQKKEATSSINEFVEINDEFDKKYQVQNSGNDILFVADELNQEHDLISGDSLEEVCCNNDFIYIINAREDISMTEYKVLNSLENTGLLKCKLIKFNGENAFYYMVGELKPLDVVAATIDSNRFIFLLKNILNQISYIKNNGFLSDRGIDARIKRIYVDTNNGDIYLTYIPINNRCYKDSIYLERNLRSDLAYIMRSLYDKDNSSAESIITMLEEKSCSFSNLLAVIRNKQ